MKTKPGHDAKQLRHALDLLHDCLWNADECQCVDPPEDRDDDDERGNDPDDPSAHSQYCPQYMLAVIKAALAGEPLPD